MALRIRTTECRRIHHILLIIFRRIIIFTATTLFTSIIRDMGLLALHHHRTATHRLELTRLHTTCNAEAPLLLHHLPTARTVVDN